MGMDHCTIGQLWNFGLRVPMSRFAEHHRRCEPLPYAEGPDVGGRRVRRTGLLEAEAFGGGWQGGRKNTKMASNATHTATRDRLERR